MKDPCTAGKEICKHVLDKRVFEFVVDYAVDELISADVGKIVGIHPLKKDKTRKITEIT